MRLTRVVTQALFGAVTAVVLMHVMSPAAEPKGPPSIRPKAARTPQISTNAPGSLEGRLDDLKKPLPGTAEARRNPFRFYVKPPRPPRLPARAVSQAVPTAQSSPLLKPDDHGNNTPQFPSPIGIKCIGTARQGKTEVAIFSDGKGLPVWAREGQTVLGEYRLLTIGVDSVTMSYLDGSGMQTIPFGPK